MSRRERISPLRCSGVLLLLSLQRVASQLAHEVRRTQSPWYLIPRGGETFGCGQIAPSLAADSGLVFAFGRTSASSPECHSALAPPRPEFGQTSPL